MSAVKVWSMTINVNTQVPDENAGEAAAVVERMLALLDGLSEDRGTYVNVTFTRPKDGAS